MISLYRFVLPACLTLLLTAQAAQAQNPNPAINVTVTSGNKSVTLTWEPPTEGPTVTGYTPNCSESGSGKLYTPVSLGGSARSYTFTGCPYSMVNGTTYSFSVTTHTDMRSNLPNTETIVSTKAGLPAAPTGLTATAGDHQVALSWTAGSNNGSALTKYEYQQNGGSWANMANGDASTTSHTVTGLTNGTQYTFKVRAVNTHGGGAASAAATATPVGPPEKPTGLTATDSDQQVALSWTAPSNTGGSAITSYEYTTDNGTTWTSTGGTTTSHTVTGLTNGTEYTFKVQAKNTHGADAASDPATATPATTPGAPTNLSAADTTKWSGGEVKLTWTAPTSTGGAAITGYDYTTDNGTTWASAGTASPYTVTNLTNGTQYTFKVRAVNRKGSTSSNEATATPATTPLAPGSLSAALPSGEAKKVKLTWTTPNNRGAAIESYNYRQNGGGWQDIQGSGASTTSHTVTGLNNGTAYTFEVRAKNRKGSSAIAGPVTATTPNTPAAPTNLTATDSDQQVALSWTAPNNGGLAITRYEYSKDNGSSWTSTGTNTSVTVTSLTNGTEYTFQVRAVNAAGNGAAATKKATPATKPAAPTLTTPVIEGNKQVRLRWPAPNNGGAAITGYDYSDDGTSWTGTGSTGTSYLVTGLTNGTTYTFKVRAKNRKGDGAESAAVTATPRNFTATAGNRSVTLNWSALPANTNIATWQYSQDNGANWTAIQGSTASTRSYTVTGLENGTEYTFQVRALNSGNTPVEHIEFPSATPRSVSTTTGGGGGGGATATADQHGDTPATATAIAADSSTPGEINARDDQDYFTISVPQAGWLVVETTGSADTRGKLTTSNGTVLAEAASGGAGRNFQVTHRVPPGTYLVAVSGTGTGSYRLEVDLFVGHLENPRPDSPQSGLGVLSGWLCAVDSVVFEIEDDPDQESWAAATGTLRPDTASECHGQAETGFGLLYNWNRLADGAQTVRLVLNGIPVETRTVTVTTLGEEVLRGATGETTLSDFPTAGETVGLVWQETQQNFRLAPPGSLSQPPAPLLPLPAPLIGYWETPSPDSFQSGLSVLSGWVCEADSIVFEIGDDPLSPFHAATGTLRPDTAPHCEGEPETGFGLLYNWNRVGDGDHTVRLVIDGAVVDTRTVTVTTLGQEVMWGLTRTAEVADFPSPGQVVTVEWQEAHQNFVITGVGE